MTRGMIFWMLMILWFVFGIIGHFFAPGDRWIPLGSTILVFVLFALLGWEIYGPAVKGK